MDSEVPENSLTISPDHLLKLRKSISESLSLTIEYLRDRWDASVAGAMGLHPDARAGAAVTSAGERFTLAWDAKESEGSVAAEGGGDPLILAAVRAMAIWLREDENEVLRREAGGLGDMLVELYRKGGGKRKGKGGLDFRRAVLVAWEGILAGEVDQGEGEEEEQTGVGVFLENGGWEALSEDMLSILEGSSKETDEDDAARGIEIVRVLLPIAEAEQPGTREAWMDVVTKVAAWYVPDQKQPPVVEEFQVAVLQLVTTLLANTHRGMQKRYVYSTSAVLGIAEHLKRKIRGDLGLEEALRDVMVTLAAMR